MCNEMVFDNDAAKLELEQADHKAAEAWRFRHLKSRETQMLNAVLSGVVRFLRKTFSPEKTAAGSVRKRLSY